LASYGFRRRRRVSAGRRTGHELEVAGLGAALLVRRGVAVFLEVLAEAALPGPVSVGRVCGGRVAAVWLGASLQVVSSTLEAHELDDPAAAAKAATAFVAGVLEALSGGSTLT
jgi:hypothetical protein